MDKKTTIKDIAKEAGVSFQVVSAILSGKESSIRFSKKTEQKVKDVAQKLSYSPSILAKGFQANRSFLIGIIGSYHNSFMHTGIVRGTQETLFSHGFSPMFLSHRNDEEELMSIQHLISRQAEGIIFNTSSVSTKKVNAYKKLLGSKIHLVSLFDKVTKVIPSVRQNMYEVGYNATTHLIEKGKRKVALFTHEEYKKNYDSLEQFKGYRDAAKEHGIKTKVFTHTLEGWNADSPLSWYQPALRKSKSILADKDVDGLVCYDTSHCYALIQTAEKMGVPILDRLSLIGYHDWDICKISRPTISSINVSPYEMGVQASQLMLDLINGKSVEDAYVSPVIRARDTSLS